MVAAQRKDRGVDIIGETLVDITDHMHNGRLYWDVPEGNGESLLLKKHIRVRKPIPETTLIRFPRKRFVLT